jgi:hypothetical protein
VFDAPGAESLKSALSRLWTKRFPEEAVQAALAGDGKASGAGRQAIVSVPEGKGEALSGVAGVADDDGMMYDRPYMNP